MKRAPILAVVTILVCLLVAMSAWPATAAGAPSSTPVEELWMTNGAVNASAIGPDGTVYIGGSFTYVGPRTGSCSALDATSGAPDLSLPVVEGTVNAVVSDEAGGYYIGGLFTKVGGITRNNIAHIMADGSVDPAFDPNANGIVWTLAVSGSTVYVGGSFTSIDGQTRNRIAALDATTGSATTWDPNANAAVRALAVSGSIVYAGGDFSGVSSIGGQTRGNIAALDAGSGAATAWNPNADNQVYALAVSGSTVYAGGWFGWIGGQTRGYVAALDATTGAATAWDPQANGGVYALAVSGSTVYAGGSFSFVGGQARSNIAALDATTDTNNATAWNPNANNTVSALAVSGSTVYAGGQFTSIGGLPRDRVAALDASSGAVTAWDPNANSSVSALAISGSTVYAGGGFTSIGGKTRNRIAALDPSSGAATAWNPNANSTVYALAVSGSTIYAGGDFTTIGGQTRNRIGALDASSGSATSFDPSASGSVRALAVSGSTVYVGGIFTTIGGQTRNRIAALDATSGIATAWDPNANNWVAALAVSGSTVYVGGAFTTINGTSRICIAALDATSGTATAWDPNSNNAVFALAVSGSTVYAGGQFSSIGGAARNSIAALDATTNTNNATPWNPNAGAATVFALAPSGSTIYAGGIFSAIGGQGRNRIAGLDVTTGTATAWNPNANSTVNTLALSGSAVYVGGNFTTIGGQGRQYLASFSLIPSGAMSVNGGAAYTTSDAVMIDNAVARATEMRFRNEGEGWSDWEDYSDTKSWVLASGDGTKTVYAEYRDAPADSLALSDTIELDENAPSGSFTVNDDTGYVNSRAVTLHPTASDLHGPVELQVRNAGAAWPGSWQALAADVSWTLTLFEGEKTIEMRFRDPAGNISDTATQTVVVETTPPSGWITVADGAYAIDTHSTTVETWANDLNGGVTMRVRNGGEPWPGTWTAAGGEVPISLPSGEGTKIVQAQFKDLAGNVILVQDEIIVDTIDPEGSLSIAGGARYAIDANVVLDLTASDATKVDAFRVRQDGGEWSGWQDMVEAQPLTLTGSDGERSVEVQYRDIAGNTSELASDAIVLDRLAPSTTDNHDEARHNSFTLVLSPVDATSGVAATEYRIDGGAWVSGTSVTLRALIRHKRGGYTRGDHFIEYRSTDNAGNLEEIQSCVVKIG